MMHLALIIFIVAVIAVVLGFGITNAVNHIAKFIFFLIIILFLIFMFYEYFSSHSVTSEPTPPATHTPVKREPSNFVREKISGISIRCGLKILNSKPQQDQRWERFNDLTI